MLADEQLMFHLTKGALRRWSLWNETTLPPFAIGEEEKFALFQDWKNKPYTETTVQGEDGKPMVLLHTMSKFENWPYWLILDLCRTAFHGTVDFTQYLSEPETLMQVIVDACEQAYAQNEEQPISNLAT